MYYAKGNEVHVYIDREHNRSQLFLTVHPTISILPLPRVAETLANVLNERAEQEEMTRPVWSN